MSDANTEQELINLWHSLGSNMSFQDFKVKYNKAKHTDNKWSSSTNSNQKSKPEDKIGKVDKFFKGAGDVLKGAASGIGYAVGDLMSDKLGKNGDGKYSHLVQHERNVAALARERAAEQQQEAQVHQQIANRDPRAEGQKDAATKAAAHYVQNMEQETGAAGAGAAALASMNVQDPSAFVTEHRQRGDAERIKAEATKDASTHNKMNSSLANATSEEWRRMGVDDRWHDVRGSWLSRGNGHVFVDNNNNNNNNNNGNSNNNNDDNSTSKAEQEPDVNGVTWEEGRQLRNKQVYEEGIKRYNEANGTNFNWEKMRDDQGFRNRVLAQYSDLKKINDGWTKFFNNPVFKSVNKEDSQNVQANWNGKKYTDPKGKDTVVNRNTIPGGK